MGLDRTILIRKETDSNIRIYTFRANPVVSSFQAPPGWAWGSPRGGPGWLSDRENTALRGVRVAIGPRKHGTSAGPGRNRAEKTRHAQGFGTQSGRGNPSLRGVRAAIGPRKHVTSRGPGRNRTEKTSHSDGKIQYFTVDFFAGSHRLRARAPEIRESSIGLANPRAGVADLP